MAIVAFVFAAISPVVAPANPLPATALLVSSATLALASSPVVSVPIPFAGTLYVPDDGLPHPGVLLLHGLEGGAATDRVREARFFASKGFAALAFCWFGCDEPVLSIPSAPHDIDLSRTYEAFRWLRSSSYVKHKPTAIYGVSLGAQQALVLAVYLAQHPEYITPNAVVVHAPSDEIQGGNPPLWTWQGDLRGLQPGSPIQLARYSGGLLVTQGLEDSQQAVSASRKIEQRVRSAGTAVRTLVHEADPTLPPLVVEPSEPGVARMEFHYFKLEGGVFDPAMDAIRLNEVIEFLQNKLGS